MNTVWPYMPTIVHILLYLPNEYGTLKHNIVSLHGRCCAVCYDYSHVFVSVIIFINTHECPSLPAGTRLEITNKFFLSIYIGTLCTRFIFSIWYLFSYVVSIGSIFSFSIAHILSMPSSLPFYCSPCLFSLSNCLVIPYSSLFCV